MSRAQIEGQTLMYALSAIIAGFLLLFGYSALTTFQQEGQGAENMAFENSLRNKFDSVDFGTRFPVDVLVPQGVTKLCFANSFRTNPLDRPINTLGDECTAISAIKRAADWGVDKDVFVLNGKQVVSSFSMVNLTVPGRSDCIPAASQCFCVEAKGGKAQFYLYGKGKSIGVCP